MTEYTIIVDIQILVTYRIQGEQDENKNVF